MKKVSKNNRDKVIDKYSKPNKLFSPKNLLLFFVSIILLLLVFNYFNSFFNKNSGFVEDSDLGNLYQSRGGDSSSDPYSPSCSGNPVHRDCGGLFEPICGPMFPPRGKWVICDKNGVWHDCPRCSSCKKCGLLPDGSDNWKAGCVPDSDANGDLCGGFLGFWKGTCSNGMCK